MITLRHLIRLHLYKERIRKLKISNLYLRIVVFCLLLPIGISAQIDLKKEGDRFFKQEMYIDALYYYDQLPEQAIKGKLQLRKGISAFYGNNLTSAISSLSEFQSNNPNDKDGLLYLAKAYHNNKNYKQAVVYYKKFLSRLDKSDSRRTDIINDIKKCAYGIRHLYTIEKAFVENLGDNVNGPYDELNPIQSPNNGYKYYFSASREESEGGRRSSDGLLDEVFGEYKLDMYSSEVINGSWQYPKTLNPLLNSSQNDLILDFNREGNILYYLKSLSKEKGSILVDTFSLNQEPDYFPDPLISPIVGEQGDVFMRVFNDSTYIFASDRKGGFGGYDLYVTSLSNGVFIEPVNLGSDINSSFDEITPYISRDGQKLFFSSNRPNAFGGFDIFSARYNREGMFWNETENLGVGINSPADDIYYYLSSDGNSAVFCSDRKSGKGGQDLYIAYLKERDQSNEYVSREMPFYDPAKYIALAIDTTTIDSSLVTEVVSIPEKVVAAPESNLIERESRSINLEPFYFDQEDYMLTPQNLSQLNDLIDVMTIFPEVSILLTSYALKEGLPEFDLYFSIKRAEKLQQYLVEKGIKEDRINLVGVGSNYPLVKENLGGVPSNLAKKVNRRVEIEVLNTDDIPLNVSIEEPVVADYLKDKKYELFQLVNEDVAFKVKIAQVNQLFNNAALRNFNDVMIEQKDDGYLYTVGYYTDFFSALGVKKRLINDGFDAKVIPYKNGLMLSDSRANRMAEGNRELKRWIENR